MKKNLARLLMLAMLVASMGLFGCSDGDDGKDGKTGPVGPPGPEGPAGPPASAEVSPESCVICHNGTGDEHQAYYDQLFQDGVIKVTDLAYESVEGSDVVTFNMTKDGAAFDCTEVDNLNIYWAPYDADGNFQFNPAEERLSIKGTLGSDAGACTSTNPASALGNLDTMDGVVVVYGYDESVKYKLSLAQADRVRQVKFPYAALAETGEGVDYVSAANNAGCVKCHTDPYLKHGNIYAQVDKVAATDFITCKACHLDNGTGGHFEWQLAVDDPKLWVKFAEGSTTEDENATIAAKYAYKTRLMNDVHMSHAMEFPYPQSMANCVTCHEGKLDITLADENFVLETCKSCHPVNGGTDYPNGEGDYAYDFTGLALTNIIPHGWNDATLCNICHQAGETGIAPVFSQIHTGYDKVIYSDTEGTKYSEEYGITIDAASLSEDNILTISFSGDEAIVPTLLVGLYGYDTKDFIVSPHSRDENRVRLLEYTPGDNNPRFTVVTAAGGEWVITADLSMWADLLADGTVKRAEIGVMPALTMVVGEVDDDVNGEDDDYMVALNAPSRTFDLVDNAFDDGFYDPIVKVADGCNNCHDALATTFHSPDRGGNVVVCRLCHVTTSGGSHLEMQSRSIDSYAHAIHTFQAFDTDEVDFNDPVEALHYEDHTELFPYPTHGIENCESCHEEGTYNVPDQSKSLPGLHSASYYPLDGWDRNIGEVPSYVTGPASRACGGCHRAVLINEDAAGELAAFNSHTGTFGYLLVDEPGLLDSVIEQIMSIFK